MPKIKMPKNSPSIDMTPMVDLAFLLVTFFMLISQFRAEEAAVIDMPSSVSDLKIPDKDLMMVLVDKGRAYISSAMQYNGTLESGTIKPFIHTMEIQ